MILVERYDLRRGTPALASTAARVSRATGSSPWHKHSWRALPLPRRHSASHWRRQYQFSAPRRLLAAMKPDKWHTKARGGVCHKAAVSNHTEGQLRRLTEAARLLHRCHHAMGRAGRDVLQVTTQLYYVVSSSPLSLVHHSKQISKTQNTQQAKASSNLSMTRTPPCHPTCQWPLLAMHETSSSTFLQVLMPPPKRSPQA